MFTGILSWDFLQFLIALVAIFGFALTTATLFSFLDRKIMAYMQDRVGPIHTGGPWGVLQAVADVGKLLLKEVIVVSASDQWLYRLAPALFIAPIIATFTVLPFSITAALYLLVNVMGTPNWIYLILLGGVNWAALAGFIVLIGRVTTVTTRKAQAPAIRAQLRTVSDKKQKLLSMPMR
jgi:NADH:ubiquinone oxidoreductase subunit H